jgi:hypothetical protein
MADSLFDKTLSGAGTPPTDEENRKELEELTEKDYLREVKKKESKNLIKLTALEKERIARYIKTLYEENKDEHKTVCDNIDHFDDVYRMKRGATVRNPAEEGFDYCTPLSTVTLEVIHANTMNVFFTPKDWMRIIPTEQGDIPKIKKLDTFGNWSMKNEMELFERCDRLFHASAKNGENPYFVHWVKEYGTEIKTEIIPDPQDPSKPLLDDVTKEPMYQEREEAKLLYNGPRLEVFSRKDYIIPKNAVADKTPPWEMRRLRLGPGKVRRRMEEGKYYDGCFDEIGGWGQGYDSENSLIDKDGKDVPLGDEKLFIEFYGTLRVEAIKQGKDGKEQYEELEEEFIATVELVSETLCCLKKNKFPMKMRPIGLDVFIPDDEGRLGGTGVIEFMDSIHCGHDALYNQFMFGIVQANNPWGFFSPTGNMRDEPIKTRAGYLYPTSDPASVNIVKLPGPDQSLANMMEKMENQAQVLFGVSDYAAGVESSIDPTAPAKKAELVVQQGNVRLNLIIKRKNQTLKDIFKRWFLLYQANMPPNKFMRIAGEDSNNPWKFEAVSLSDFALNSIPDFELTGNVLNANKQLEAQKAIAVYRNLIGNPLFAPTSQQGIQALTALTKWMLDKLDETGVSGFLPSVPGEKVITPEEENARFLQGDTGEPTEGEDHVAHMKAHALMAVDATVPEEIRKELIKHIQAHAEMLKNQINHQMVLANARQTMPQGGTNVGTREAGSPVEPSGFVSESGMEGFSSGSGFSV